MSTIKINLIAVTALAILTAQRIPMANAFTPHPASGGVIRLHNDHSGQLEAYRSAPAAPLSTRFGHLRP
jgi:hypothetical protein